MPGRRRLLRSLAESRKIVQEVCSDWPCPPDWLSKEHETLETPNAARSKNTTIPPPDNPAGLGEWTCLSAVRRPHGRVLLWHNREWKNFFGGAAHSSWVSRCRIRVFDPLFQARRVRTMVRLGQKLRAGG